MGGYMFRRYCIALCLAVFVTQSVYATPYLDAVVVRDTQSMKHDDTATTSVVWQETIAHTNCNTAPQILSTIPGVFITGTGAFGRSDITMRGLGTNGTRIMVLVDDRPVKMGLFGCVITHMLPVTDVDHINVIKGPASVLYGSDALGGVVNIHTKQATASKPSGTIFASMGTYNTQRYALEYGETFSQCNVFVSADRRFSDGHTTNSAYDGKTYSMRVGYTFSPTTDFVLHANAYDGFKQEPLPAKPYTWNLYKRGAVDGTLRMDVADGILQCKAYRDFGEHHFSDPWDSTDYTNSMTLDWKRAAGKHQLLVGGDVQQQQGQRYNQSPGEWTQSTNSLYLHDEVALASSLVSTLGVRYNFDDALRNQQILVPSFGMVYTHDATTLRMHVSQGFRNPSLKDLYLYPSSNPLLTRETVTSYECAVRHTLHDTIALDVTGYVMDGSNLIASRSDRLQNIDTFWYRGIETQCTASLSPDFSTNIAYTYFDPSSKTQGKVGDKADGGLIYQKEKIYGTCGVQYVGNYFAADNRQQKIDDYCIARVQCEYEVHTGLKIFGAIENIFDTTYKLYVENPGSTGLYTMPGRTIDVGIRYAF